MRNHKPQSPFAFNKPSRIARGTVWWRLSLGRIQIDRFDGAVVHSCTFQRDPTPSRWGKAINCSRQTMSDKLVAATEEWASPGKHPNTD
jgi:hypothetical protein